MSSSLPFSYRNRLNAQAFSSSNMAQTISGDAFDLEYMHFNENGYEELLMQKVESILTLIHGEPSFQLCINEDGSRTDRVTVISSPNVHCRERLRFALQSREVLMSISSSSGTRSFLVPEASSIRETVPQDLVYAMWDHGFPTVIVEVCHHDYFSFVTFLVSTLL